jgi:flagellar hook-basal body complex protein FliE
LIKGISFQPLNLTTQLPLDNKPSAPGPESAGGIDLTKSFGQFLTEAVSDFNQQKANVSDLQQKFITGEMPDVHRLMIEAEKSSLATALTIQIRNKVVEAYQEIMRTQI